jgi:hypothetical protein
MRVFAAFSFTQMMSSSWIISIRESSTLTMGLQWAYNGLTMGMLQFLSYP